MFIHSGTWRVLRESFRKNSKLEGMALPGSDPYFSSERYFHGTAATALQTTGLVL